MSDNVLKKDFNKKDVERLRNLVKGKAGERTTQGIGYTKKEEFHKEGDIWEADGRKSVSYTHLTLPTNREV